METYNCEICGKNHELIKAIEIPTPERILEIPESEIEQRVKEIQGSYIIDDKIFLLKGDIFIYKVQNEKPFFNWSVWVSIALTDFTAKTKELQERKNVEFNGLLETDLPFYKRTKGLSVKTIINLDYDYAVIKVAEESQLKKDQSQNITEKRIMELMQMAYHHPDQTNSEFDK